MRRLFLIAFVAALISNACRKDIHLDLNNATGHIVIEANIDDQAGPYYVGISRTIAFYDSNAVVPVNGVSIILTDNIGNKDSLTDTGWPGLYQTHTMQGVPGRSYHITIIADGQKYEANSSMPAPVPIDSIGYQTFGFQSKQYWLMYCRFKDSPAIVNYYKAFLYVNGKKQSKITTVNDELTNGNIIQANLSPDFFINRDDTVVAELNTIDQSVYEYFHTLNTATLGTLNAAPSNPTSNFTNGALGYFSAHTVTRSKAIKAH